MALSFEPNLEHQVRAVQAVVRLFAGQELSQSKLSLPVGGMQTELGQQQSDFGVGNRLVLDDEALLSNLQAVQVANGLPVDEVLRSRDFTVEMETGTGKTYVYLRTIMELRKRYGFTKFIIVVPSLAVKEAAIWSLRSMAAHFRDLYDGLTYTARVYDSGRPEELVTFATSGQVQVLVMTVASMNRKELNVLNQEHEAGGGYPLINLLRATQPVVIVDEPQSVDGGPDGRGKEALDQLGAVATLRYSATHRDPYHLVYQLTALEAHELGLVKSIEVAGSEVEEDGNRPYIRLLSSSARGKKVRAKVELHMLREGRIRTGELSVEEGDSLADLTKIKAYQGYRIGEIHTKSVDGGQALEVLMPGAALWLSQDEALADIDRSQLHRQMIRRTIREHFEKALSLESRGIKVLSLFFVDHVSSYRRYDAEGKPVKGELAVAFEEEFLRLASRDRYSPLFEGLDLTELVDAIHGGYFAVDKNRFTDVDSNSLAAAEAFELIMRHKERLLDLDTPLRFIFTHSALREGWDNPNVFQVCALREMASRVERRQTIGRGLRLCVDQEFQRVHDSAVNVLTVVAFESFEEFAEGLQEEFERAGIVFGQLKLQDFASITSADDSALTIGEVKALELFAFFETHGYLKPTREVTDALREDLAAGNLALPSDLEGERLPIEALLKRYAHQVVHDARRRVEIHPRLDLLYGPDFTALWDRIGRKTYFQSAFDRTELIAECVRQVEALPEIPRVRLQWRKAEVVVSASGVAAGASTDTQTVALSSTDIPLPDLLSELEESTGLTRASITRILRKSGRLHEFSLNPRTFILRVSQAINGAKNQVVASSISYHPRAAGNEYRQAAFEESTLTGYEHNLLAARKSVLDHVNFDKEVERAFAEALEADVTVRVFTKLPPWFTIATPFGTYNPDWGVVFEKDDGGSVFRVIETKGSIFEHNLRTTENAKIECGRRHFGAIAIGEEPAEFVVATSLEEVSSALL